jgi:anti-anti-sigma factor
MAVDQFSVEIVDGRLIVRGELDLAAVSELEASTVDLDGQLIEVDLGGVTFLDSAGLRALWNTGRSHPGVRFVNPSPNVRRLLELTKMTDLIAE